MNDSIGARLREERERLGLSQTDLAQIAARAGATGSTRQSQSIYEKGERMPDAGYLAAITAEGIDVVYVLTGQRDTRLDQGVQLQDGEATLLEGYRALDARGKAGVIALIAGLKPESNPKPRKTEVVQHAHAKGTTQIGKVVGGLRIGKK